MVCLRDRSAPRSAQPLAAAARIPAGSGYLHRVLHRLDAAAAERIHANDVPKLIRAIEVCLAVRRPMTELWQEGRAPLTGFRILRIGLNPEREALYGRINDRAAKMFDEGLIAETEALLTKYGAEARPLSRSDTNRLCNSCVGNWIASRRGTGLSRHIAITPSGR